MLNELWEVHSFKFRISLDWGVPQWLWHLKIALIIFFNLLSLSVSLVMRFSSWGWKVSCACHGSWEPCWGWPTPVCLSPEEFVNYWKACNSLLARALGVCRLGFAVAARCAFYIRKVGEMKLVFVSCGRKCLARSENASLLTCASAWIMIWNYTKRLI